MRNIIKIEIPELSKEIFFHSHELLGEEVETVSVDDDFVNQYGCTGGYLRQVPYLHFRLNVFLDQDNPALWDDTLQKIQDLQAAKTAKGYPEIMVIHWKYGLLGEDSPKKTVQFLPESYVQEAYTGNSDSGVKALSFIETVPPTLTVAWDSDNQCLQYTNPYTDEPEPIVRIVWFCPSHLPKPKGLISGIPDCSNFSKVTPEIGLIYNYSYDVIIDGVNVLTIPGQGLTGYIWGSTGTIPGLTFDPAIANLSGAPTTAGKYDLMVYCQKGEDEPIIREYTVDVNPERVDNEMNGSWSGLSFWTLQTGPTWGAGSLPGWGKITIPSTDVFDLWSDNHAPFLFLDDYVNSENPDIQTRDFTAITRVKLDTDETDSFFVGMGIRFQAIDATNVLQWGFYGPNKLVAQRTGEAVAVEISNSETTLDLKIERSGNWYHCYYKNPLATNWILATSYNYAGVVICPCIIGKTWDNRAVNLEVDYFYCSFADNYTTNLEITSNNLLCYHGQNCDQVIEWNGGFGEPEFLKTSGNLPAGLSLNTSGEIEGVASEIGSFSFVVRGTDLNGAIASKQVTIQVDQLSESAIFPTVLPKMYVGETVDVDFTLAVVGYEEPESKVLATDDDSPFVTSDGKKIKIVL